MEGSDLNIALTVFYICVCPHSRRVVTRHLNNSTVHCCGGAIKSCPKAIWLYLGRVSRHCVWRSGIWFSFHEDV
jgi:hypothetical protein